MIKRDGISHRGVKLRHRRSGGYLLPAILSLGLGISVAGGIALQVISQNSSQLSDQSYRMLANQAAKAGVTAAQNCLNRVGFDDVAWPLETVDCGSGATPAGVIGSGDAGVSYETSFSVTGDDSQAFGGNVGTLLVAVGEVKVNNVTVSTDTVRAFVPTAGSGRVSRNVTQISVGPATSCVIATDFDGTNGWPYCWGDGSNHQLGVGYHLGDADRSLAYTTVPLAVARGHVDPKPEQVQRHFVCNGFNTRILGLGCLSWGSYYYTDWYVPASPAGDSAMAGKVATKVSVGTDHTCAIARDSENIPKSAKLYCWGRNGSGQLGTRTNTDALLPVAVDMQAPWSVTVPGYCGGFWLFGNCIGWVAAVTTNYPGSALNNKTVIDVSAGNYFTCVRYLDSTDPRIADATMLSASDAANLGGKIACWGRNNHGQLGNGTRSGSDIPIDTTMGASSSFQGTKFAKKLAIVKGGDTMCAIDTDNNTHCWGQNFSGQTGDSASGSTSDWNLPIPLWCPLGGPNYPGLRTSQDRLTPRQVLNVSDPVTGNVKHRDVIIYDDWAAATSTRDRMWYWGGTTSTGCFFILGIGSVWYRQYTIAPMQQFTRLGWFASSFPLLTSGNVYSGLFCAVKADNGLYCTNARETAPTPSNPNPPAPPAPIRLNDNDLLVGRTVVGLDTSAKGDYGCIITKVDEFDGQAACWGLNSQGQLGNRTTAPRTTAFPVDVYGVVGDSSSSELGTVGTLPSSRVIYF